MNWLEKEFNYLQVISLESDILFVQLKTACYMSEKNLDFPQITMPIVGWRSNLCLGPVFAFGVFIEIDRKSVV